jgi:hypothetical protein
MKTNEVLNTNGGGGSYKKSLNGAIDAQNITGEKTGTKGNTKERYKL